MNSAFHHEEDHHQDYNGFYGILNSDQDPELLSIGDTIINPLDKCMTNFDDIKLPSNEIINYEADDHYYYQSFDYENTDKDVLSPEVDIEPLSLFADNNSEAGLAFALNNDSNKDTDNYCEHFKTKESSKNSDEVTESKVKPTVKISQPSSDTLPKTTKRRKKAGRCKKTRPAKKELSIKYRRFRKFGYTRWGRNEDCLMFSVLRQLCNQESVNIEDFYNDYSIKSIEHDLILINLVSQMNWRSDTQSLLKRIQTLARDQTLSVRQIHMLKRFKKKAIKQKKEFSVEDVVDSFPGKTISTLQSAFETS